MRRITTNRASACTLLQANVGKRTKPGARPYLVSPPLATLRRVRRILAGRTTVGTMKHYKLQAWPELGAPFHRTAHRRMLHRMSQRYVSLPRLMKESGLGRAEVLQFLETLHESGLLAEYDIGAPDSRFGAFRPLAWLRRTFLTEAAR